MGVDIYNQLPFIKFEYYGLTEEGRERVLNLYVGLHINSIF